MKGPYWISEYVYIYSQYGLEKIGFPKFDDIILVAKRDSRDLLSKRSHGVTIPISVEAVNSLFHPTMIDPTFAGSSLAIATTKLLAFPTKLNSKQSTMNNMYYNRLR
jgi:hypothetical protein